MKIKEVEPCFSVNKCLNSITNNNYIIFDQDLIKRLPIEGVIFNLKEKTENSMLCVVYINFDYYLIPSFVSCEDNILRTICGKDRIKLNDYLENKIALHIYIPKNSNLNIFNKYKGTINRF